MTAATRTCRLTRTAEDTLALVIRQRGETGRLQVDAYFLTEQLAASPDRRFLLSKHEGTRYELLLRGEGGSCTCPGHRFRGRKSPCKHVAAIRTLIAAGKL